MVNKKINFEIFRKGVEEVRVDGIPNSKERLNIIERAITEIQSSPETALSEKFFGVKSYAGFGDQECDLNYGYGPRHGSIVFCIGRADLKNKITNFGIYALEVLREFGTKSFIDIDSTSSKQRTLNIIQAFIQFETKCKALNYFMKTISDFAVEEINIDTDKLIRELQEKNDGR